MEFAISNVFYFVPIFRSGAKLKAFEESDKSHLKGTSVAFDSGRQKVLDGLMASLQHSVAVYYRGYSTARQKQRNRWCSFKLRVTKGGHKMLSSCQYA